MTIIIMTETNQESLLDNLLKTRYPLSYYLNRQQEFGKVFSPVQTNAVHISFGMMFIFLMTTLYTYFSLESKTSMIYQRKGPLPSCYYVPDTNDHQQLECTFKMKRTDCK